ncbi:DinB family protein [Nocardioides aurantiacus]|uniref:Uncharacterized protein DUF664 n=1 Tax=Nocardioides aurantiacus TaxID=86796 RepID=A0A3N2CTR2_9ACTN|nr:DinB family protein [Nocardioides aurantiacus]ROR90917.1 uncharacterized protein DUF664 [Nocardioides aurantiacus]
MTKKATVTKKPPARQPKKRRRDAPPPSTGNGEKDVLLGFLNYLRASIAAKVEGTPEPDVRTPGVPSGTNLIGLIHHVTHVERYMFLGENVTDWPATFHVADDVTVDDVLAAYRAAVDEANDVIADSGLDEPTRRPTPRKKAPSMRWALAHMIEETGRHAGHADILRELIDGQTGR